MAGENARARWKIAGHVDGLRFDAYLHSKQLNLRGPWSFEITLDESGETIKGSQPTFDAAMRAVLRITEYRTPKQVRDLMRKRG